MHMCTTYYTRYRFPFINKLHHTVDVIKLHYLYTANRQNSISPLYTKRKVLYLLTMSSKRVSLKQDIDPLR